MSKVRNHRHFNFDDLAHEVMEYQLEHNDVYNTYVHSVKGANPIQKLIYLPISAFKSHHVVTSVISKSKTYFESSGTTGSINSRHYYEDQNWYLENAVTGFEQFYDPISSYCFLALLPHYLERSNSSLIAMIRHFIEASSYENSGFFLNNQHLLNDALQYNQTHKIPTILFGVSFALLDFAQLYPISFPDLIIMETGGMKGRKEEMTRADLHHIISSAFGTTKVHSEYGMTELFSQAYSQENGIFRPPATMRVSAREITDPFAIEKYGKTGVLNIIDLANIDSCSFIATDDLGEVYADGSFTVSGRLDESDIRGCNLMVI